MNEACTHNGPAGTDAPNGAATDPRRLEQVRAIFVSLSKYINSKTIYADNNPIVGKFADSFYQSLQVFFKEEKELQFAVEQYRITWRGETVYKNSEKKESLAFLLFKDGVGELIFQAGVKPAELERFVDLVKSEICCPSTQLDMVGKLWQAEFTGISYRVFDEEVDGTAGPGRGSSGASGEQKLRFDDYQRLPGAEASGGGNSALIDQSGETLAARLYATIDRNHPGADARQRERQLQRLLEALFTVRPEESDAWSKDCSAAMERDRLLWFLNAMLDFARPNAGRVRGACTGGARPPAERDVLDIVERVVRYIAEEANVPTLIELHAIRKTLAAGGATAPGFESLPVLIERELTNTDFLLALAKKAGRSRGDARQVLEYLRLIGDAAVRPLREILAVSSDATIHAEACDDLLSVACDYIMPIVEDLDLDNPLEAYDAVYLLRNSATGEVPAVIEKLLASPDARMRANTIGFLAQLGTDQAAALLCDLLDDREASVRLGTLAAVEELDDPLFVARMNRMCFEDDLALKGMEELERMFRALGKLAGASVLDRIGRMAATRSLGAINTGRARRNKLLAATALRHIPGPDSRRMLEKLARDRDKLVRSKAQHVLNVPEEHEETRTPDETAAAVEEQHA